VPAAHWEHRREHDRRTWSRQSDCPARLGSRQLLPRLHQSRRERRRDDPVRAERLSVSFANYLENNSIGINIGNGVGEVADGAPLTSHDRPDDTVISFNVLVDSTTHYVMSGRTDGLGATNTTFANNFIYGGGIVASIRGPYPGAVWRGNVLWNTGDPGDMPPEGYTIINP